MIIKSDKELFLDYLKDASNYTGECDKVYIPENEKDLVEILRECYSAKTKITISGARTGLTGAASPQGGVVISMEKFNKIIEINKDEKYAVVESGVILSNFISEISRQNLFYPPDPTEQNCSIGGNIACNASGAKTYKYGPTRSYILALEGYLSNGKKFHIERNTVFAKGLDFQMALEDNTLIKGTLPNYQMPKVKNAAGYYAKPNMDLIDLFIGSEGGLAAITKAKLKLIDSPKKLLSIVAYFNDELKAFDFLEDAKLIDRSYHLSQSPVKISPRALEYFDSRSLNFIKKDYANMPEEARGAVWFEQEIEESNEENTLNLWIELMEKHKALTDLSWFAMDEKELAKIKDFRHSVSWKVAEYIAQKNIKKVGTDFAVPNENFKEYFNFVKQKAEESNVDYLMYGHFGNSHIHLNFLPQNQEEYDKAKKHYRELAFKAVELKGTVSAEHGIGKLKKEYLEIMYGKENILKMALVKKAFDDKFILNPDNIFSESILKEIEL